MGSCRGNRARLSSVLPRGGIGDNGHGLKYRKFCLNIWKHFFFTCTDGWTVERAAQRDGGVSTCEKLLRPEEMQSWAPCCSWPCMRSGLGLDEWRPLPASIILWFRSEGKRDMSVHFPFYFYFYFFFKRTPLLSLFIAFFFLLVNFTVFCISHSFSLSCASSLFFFH